MDWFKNFKVRVKMIVSFLVVVALLVVLAVISVVEMNSVSARFEEAIEGPMAAELHMLTFEMSTIDLRRLTATAAVFASVDPSRVSAYSAEIAPIRAYGMDALNAYRHLVEVSATLTANEMRGVLQTLNDLENLYNRYIDECTAGVLEEGARGDLGNMMGYVAMSVAIADEINAIVSELVAVAARDAEINSAEAEAAANRTVVIIMSVSAAAAIAAISISLYISSIISKPLLPLTNFMVRAGSTGDIALTDEENNAIRTYGKMKDEIGQTIGATASFVEHVTNMANNLDTIAHGDLSVDVKTLSDKDTMGVSMKYMLDQLNDMFGEISVSSNQVSTGTKQIADGAQSLAQGSTEQAASVQQLSASIGEVAAKTKENAEMAGRAAILAGSIKESAEKGNRQMDEMVAAVGEINEASKSISKVIKTIDDIAFQTNILALNAAVEAARAGQHGKGFAVVAEEVRNLAAKSADAAKETGEMIQNSMDKAELGSRIAGETAESLTEIVSGISESSALIGDIAQSSDEQSAGIAQINTGIDQVAKVVQQNSATAEQSAAAAEEMSGQSEMLRSLVEQFKLRNSGGAGGKRLPATRDNAGHAALPGSHGIDFDSSGGSFGKY